MNLDSLIHHITSKAAPAPALRVVSNHARLPTNAIWPFEAKPVTVPLQRRALIAKITLSANRFNLVPLIEGLLEANGLRNLAHLPEAELVSLDEWLEAHLDRLQTCCSDPATPPAD